MHVNKLFSAVNKFEGNEKATVMIDAENVRGKSGFALSHADLFEGVALWTERWNLTGRVSLVVDHGAVPSGYWLDEYGFSVVFAGSGQKADGALACDVGFFLEYMESKLVIVVTADQELISRCHMEKQKISRKSEMLDMVKSKSLTAADVVSKIPFEGYQRLLELGYEAVDLEAKSSDQALRLVVVSDTHGFERTLTPNGSTLPDGDVLLHLGDFAVDGRKCREKLVQFDEWLAGQPHPTKIVVRGNHDPFSTFPLSESIFVVELTTIKLHNDTFSLSLIPYCSDRDIALMSLVECDIVASHVPPRNILDRCNSGSRAGSLTLHLNCSKRFEVAPTIKAVDQFQ